ncbi:unnamed protein product [Arabidopsis thaliana]|uniref:(thale cress) hypothetical protein n=1 Tax=Arabidopsis thaliana TaxID=3702 RepID=A0A7G2EWZ2_ARATH|nr:unnamed protein product [Arabidopsis thaliana]
MHQSEQFSDPKSEVEVLRIYFPSDLKESNCEFGVVGKISRRARISKFRSHDPSFILRVLRGVSGHSGALIDPTTVVSDRGSVREATGTFRSIGKGKVARLLCSLGEECYNFGIRAEVKVKPVLTRETMIDYVKIMAPLRKRGRVANQRANRVDDAPADGEAQPLVGDIPVGD